MYYNPQYDNGSIFLQEILVKSGDIHIIYISFNIAGILNMKFEISRSISRTTFVQNHGYFPISHIIP